MKTFKKISLGLVVLFGILIFGVLAHKPALAAGCGYSACSQSDITSVSDWTFKDQNNITATFQGTPVTFTDNKPFDGNHRYDAPAGIFCSGGGGGSLTSGLGSIQITDWSQVTSGTDPVTATVVDIDYYDTGIGTTPQAHCINWGNIPQGNIQAVSIKGTPTTVVSGGSWLWSGTTIVSGDNKNVLTPVNSDNLLYGKSTSDQCNGGTIIKLDSPQSSTGNLYSLVTWQPRGNPIGIDANGESSLVNSSGQPYYASQKCIVTSGPTAINILASYSGNGQPSNNCVLQDNGEWVCTVVNPGPVSGGGTTGGTTCESSSSTALEWIMCPLFKISTALADKLITLFEGQLCFKTDVATTASGTTCKTFDTTSIKPAWSAIKNIVSGLLVIIMLISIFSQAFSIGPIDAYTIRKLLPRLVAAVILIQLSFFLFSWVINVVNDAGEGLSSLLKGIFPGDINNFYALLHNAGIGNGAAGAASWVGFIGLIGLSVAALPTLLVMLFGILISLLVGLAVLIFRKILIVTLLILAPFALLLWILPNTERYWKMWWDNFLKILLMYPIIILIIEAGRIFAWVAGANGVSGGEFIAMLIVIIGFFGPLFILPKTYKWGGSLMTAAGGTLTSLSKPVTEKGGAGLRGIGERWQGRRANKYDPQAGIVSKGIRRLQSGHAIPFSERSRRLAIAGGDKWAAERNDEASALVNRVYELAVANGYKMPDGSTLEGVAAGKQALVDLAGQDTTTMFGRQKDVANRAAKSAEKQLLDTKSFIEMQDATISRGKNKGKRASEVAPFRSALISSPPHYSEVTRNRHDMAPDVYDGAENDTGYKYADVAAGSTEYWNLEHARLSKALERLTPEQLQSDHYGLFQDVAKVSEATGSSGLADLLSSRMEDFARSGTLGQNAVGSLRGGKEKYVDEALARASRPRDLASFFPGARPGPLPPTTPPASESSGLRPVPVDEGTLYVQRSAIQPGDTVSPAGVVIIQSGRTRSTGNEEPPEPRPPTP